MHVGQNLQGYGVVSVPRQKLLQAQKHRLIVFLMDKNVGPQRECAGVAGALVQNALDDRQGFV